MITIERDQITFENHKFHLDWTQEQKQLIIKYICDEDHQIPARYWNHDTLAAYITVNQKQYRLIVSLRYRGRPCSVFKCDDCKPNWEQIRDEEKRKQQQWQKQHPDAPHKRYYPELKLVKKEDVSVCKMQMPTATIFYMEPHYANR